MHEGDTWTRKKKMLKILEFYASWASPCEEYQRHITEILGKKDVIYERIDVDTSVEQVAQYAVETVPLVVFMQAQVEDNSQETPLARLEGFEPHKFVEIFNKLYGVQGDLASDKENQGENVPKTQQQSGKDVVPVVSDDLAALVKSHDIMLFIKGTPEEPQCGFTQKLLSLLRSKTPVQRFLEHESQRPFKDASIKGHQEELSRSTACTFDILKDPRVRQGLKEYSDWPTFPQIYIKGEFVGGLDICKEIIANGEFTSLL